jgi:hypothetical protein
MDRMETDTTQPSEELSALNRRLTAVERDLAVLNKTVATKDDIARLDITLASMQATIEHMAKNFATKADLSDLETRIMKWMITTLVGVAALNSSMVLIVVKLVHV